MFVGMSFEAGKEILFETQKHLFNYSIEKLAQITRNVCEIGQIYSPFKKEDCIRRYKTILIPETSLNPDFHKIEKERYEQGMHTTSDFINDVQENKIAFKEGRYNFLY
jgi:hypothetical protein